MSVLIKNMEMPKNCGECQFCHTEYFKQWCCPTGREDIYCDAIPEWCPLEEPKAGQDCTDFVNWLLEEVMDEEMWELNAVANGEVIARKLKKLGLLRVKDGHYVRTPSTEAAHGEWIKKYNGNGWNDFWDYTCSNCGKKYERADAVLYNANYCPNCGADMRGEEK